MTSRMSPRPGSSAGLALIGALVLALAVAAQGATPVAARVAVETRRDVQYGTANGKPLLLDVYVPPGGERRRPAVLLIHGGGWRAGDKSSFAPEGRRLADRGWVALSVNYRLDEPSMYPAEVDDVAVAVRWTREHAGELGVDPDRIAALGESAGGHLTAMLATMGNGQRDVGARIAVGVAWSGPMDLTALARSRGDEWTNRVLGCSLAECARRVAAASPVNHVDSSDSPLLLLSSTEELVPLSQAKAMRARLNDAMVANRLEVYPGSRHALDYRDDAWEPTVAFLEMHLPAAPLAPGSGRRLSVLAALVGSLIVFGALRRVVRRRAEHQRDQGVSGRGSDRPSTSRSTRSL
jgi:acetyl esterase